MAISPTSFLLGLGVAWVMPLFARAFRPLAVQATAAGMSAFEEARRVLAEQAELMEDIAAEARARRDEMRAGADDGHDADATEEAAAPERARRRTNGAARRRIS